MHTQIDRTCDLCGLPLRSVSVASEESGKSYFFCCNGCLHVFRMLSRMEGLSPEDFKSSELFKKCREMGILPDPGKASDGAIPDASTESGENGETLPLHLSVGGMWCPSCAWVIDAALTDLPGVFNADCRFSTDTFRCDYDPVLTSPRQITRRIEQLGYSAHTVDTDVDRRVDRREFIRLGISTFLTMNVMMLSTALYGGFFSDLGPAGIRFLSIPIFLLATVVFFYGGRRIHEKGWRSLTLGAYGMETLISIGSSIVFAYSLWGLVQGSLHLYFDTASMLITLVLLGKTLERRAKTSAQKDLAHFFSMVPKKARICRDENREGRYVSIAYLRPGDLFRLSEGEVAPADGVVTTGRGFGDESALTGESKPKQKIPGDTVVSGTRLVNGDLVVRALHVGDESTLGQMIRLMETALGGKTPVEAQMERLLRWFVPGVIFLALATGAAWTAFGFPLETALLRMITVLVVSCPCALGIAIPLTRSVGIAAAGKKGLLIRDAAAFDRAAAVNGIIFDKTGTVTSGKWRLLEIRTAPPHTETAVLELAAGLEEGSGNAAALAVLRHAKARGISAFPVSHIKDAENGRFGIVNGQALRIGSAAFIGRSPSLPGSSLDENRAASKVYISLADEVIAELIFGDDIRPDAHDTMKTLRKLGFRLGMISGDGVAATRQVAGQLEIAECWGGMLPEDKMAIVRKWQSSPTGGSSTGMGVAVVGDGVNDAPALARSDLGIAVKAGSPLGKETAHVTLMRGELSQVIDFLNLARTVRNKIKQNLFFTVIYNATCIPIAMAGLLSPLVAVCAMLMSSLSVIGNTLLLGRRMKEKRASCRIS